MAKRKYKVGDYLKFIGPSEWKDHYSVSGWPETYKVIGYSERGRWYYGKDKFYIVEDDDGVVVEKDMNFK